MADLHDRLAAATGFQWDEGNATKNWSKHEVTQAECEVLVPRAVEDHSTATNGRPVGAEEFRELFRVSLHGAA